MNPLGVVGLNPSITKDGKNSTVSALSKIAKREGFVGGKEYTNKEGKIGYITSIKLAKIYENKPQAEAVPDAIPF